MTVLNDLLSALASGRVNVIDLTTPLSEETPILQLPPPFANTMGLSRKQVSHYDDAGPAWAWNDFTLGEHAGTHNTAEFSRVPYLRLADWRGSE